MAASSTSRVGTLYRHFPTREALVEAAYRNELARLCDAVPELLRDLTPAEATRRWMDRFVDYMTTKRGMADALRAVIASGGILTSRAAASCIAAITTLLEAGGRPGRCAATSNLPTCWPAWAACP